MTNKLSFPSIQQLAERLEKAHENLPLKENVEELQECLCPSKTTHISSLGSLHIHAANCRFPTHLSKEELAFYTRWLALKEAKPLLLQALFPFFSKEKKDISGNAAARTPSPSHLRHPISSPHTKLLPHPSPRSPSHPTPPLKSKSSLLPLMYQMALATFYAAQKMLRSLYALPLPQELPGQKSLPRTLIENHTASPIAPSPQDLKIPSRTIHTPSSSAATYEKPRAAHAKHPSQEVLLKKNFPLLEKLERLLFNESVKEKSAASKAAAASLMHPQEAPSVSPLRAESVLIQVPFSPLPQKRETSSEKRMKKTSKEEEQREEKEEEYTETT